MNDSSKAVITVGATLSHGGQVTEGSPEFQHGGRNVSYEGCSALCFMHGQTTIVGASGSSTVGGKHIAVTGDKTACGAVLTAYVEPDSEYDKDLRNQEMEIMKKYFKDGGFEKYSGTKVSSRSVGHIEYTFGNVDGRAGFVFSSGNTALVDPSPITRASQPQQFFQYMGQMVGLPYNIRVTG